ncbi:MAG: hypothetical protein AAF721_12755 [Myxococcota bacterium]
MRELACDPVARRLFAARIEDDEVAVRSIELGDDGSFGATEEWVYSNPDFLSASSVRSR